MYSAWGSRCQCSGALHSIQGEADGATRGQSLENKELGNNGGRSKLARTGHVAARAQGKGLGGRKADGKTMTKATETYLEGLGPDNWRWDNREGLPGSAEVGIGWACWVRSEGSPCRLVAGWERGVRKRQSSPIARRNWLGCNWCSRKDKVEREEQIKLKIRALGLWLDKGGNSVGGQGVGKGGFSWL
ncbi:hypothetical protein N7492_000102 [Penicillium capsulatum]|uniref:Uncharacterized protein n=1 Tax=Penicillium capsulatum TaxID=69766 RepID=A0A9W9LY83_9EURO|nr:hypothetical protein N7492_000102 [Penicillium capsulatum]KAJ6130830.1 hypothetical protein N7512_003610 [Penicillium capsulatum]